MFDPFPVPVTRSRIALAATVQALVALGVVSDRGHAAAWETAARALGLSNGVIWALAATLSVGLAAWLAANAFVARDEASAANDNSAFHTNSSMLGSAFLRER